MYRRILFGIDPAGTALGATPTVATLARRFGAEVIVLNVVRPDRGFGAAAEPSGLAAEVARDLRQLGVPATAEVRRAASGRVADEIARVAEELDADLVALGSRGRSDFMGLVAGSVGHDVAAGSDRAVLLVRPSTDPAALDAATYEPQIRRILVGVDASERFAEAVESAIELATACGARVIAAHVREAIFGAEGAAYIEPDSVGETVLAAAAERFRQAGVPAETRLLEGPASVARELIALADAVDADLIVVGSRRPTDLGGLLLGSVAHQVLHLTRRPLFIAQRGRSLVAPSAAPTREA